MRAILNSIIILTCFAVQYQNSLSEQISLEVDPAPFILNGYSFSVRYSLACMEHFSFMGSIYKSDFPDAMMSQVNKDNGWTDLEFRTSYAFFVDYFFDKSQEGFYIGPSLFIYNKSVEIENSTTSIDFTNIYPNARIGYIWYPFESLGFYLNPWFNIGSEINIDKKNKINDIEFEPNRFNYIIAIHLGYSFELSDL